MYPKHLRTCSVLLLSLFTFLSSSAQKTQQQREAIRQKVLQDTRVSEVHLSSDRETPSLIIYGADRAKYSRSQVPALLSNYLSLRTGVDNLVPKKETGMFSEIKVAEFQQYFRGIKVEKGVYKALSRGDDVQFMAGAYYDIPEVFSTTARISEAQALENAKRAMGGKKYAWEEVQERLKTAPDAKVRAILQQELKEYLPKGELVIVKDFTKERIAEMRLAFKFNLYSAEPLRRAWVYVDAQDGKILLYDRIIKHASEPTTVTTRYAGNRTIYTKQISGNDPNNGAPLVSSQPVNPLIYDVIPPGGPAYVLIDDTRGNGIETYDLNNVGGLPLSVGALYAQGKSFTDADNNWTLAQHKRSGAEGGAAEAENDDIAWDAHWGAEMVYDYWKNRHNRLSFDNNNAKIKSYVHYGPAYDNAFWNGSVMTYGDGSNAPLVGYKALTSLDVCGHEIGHAVCSNTSDLVYAKESGAMNEGFSDIWGAAVEYFTIKSVDPTLATRYKPFYIGEQISTGTQPLRRMDAPKVTFQPDTYGGVNWENPDCVPSDANDQCGVHTNSGVLNKWFYLLTVGSGAGSGPDAAYVVLNADDSKKDDTTGGIVSPDSIPYNVTGLGFDISEKIAYLTELMLTSTATYTEARAASIASATAFSGNPCGSVVESVMNAWFAVGVGPKFTQPCTITYGFVSAASTISETTTDMGCNAQKTIALPFLMPANGTANVTTTGTATLGQDYTIESSTIANSTGSVRTDTVRVSVMNDGIVESGETINISIAVSNAGGSSVNTAYTITITDDDVIPVIGTDSITLLNETFDTNAGFAGPAGWTETLEIPEDPAADPTVPGKNQWGVFDGTLSITGKETLLPALAPGSYHPNSPSQTRITPPIINALGLNTLRIRFNYTVQGEVDPAGTDPETFAKLDYMALAYSYDGVTYTELGPGYKFASAAPTSGVFDAVLPSFLNNKQFYLAFRWVNDALVGGAISIKIDNLVLKGLPRKIESQLASLGRENAGSNQDVFFYSQQDGDIIARINNSSATNFGCVTATIINAGNATRNFYSDVDGAHKVLDKIIRVAPTTNAANAAYTISLYYTLQEVQALQAATGKLPADFYIYKVTGDFSSATSSNTERVAATYTAIPNVGGIFTATFNTGFSDFALGAAVTTALPVTCVDFTGTKANNSVKLNWKVSAEVNNKNFEVERSIDGVQFETLANINANSRNGGVYGFTDNSLPASTDAYYRLKQTDATGQSTYVCSVVRIKMNDRGKFTISSIYPNPGKDNSFVKITTAERMRIRIEMVSSIGQLIQSQVQNIAAGVNIVPLNTKAVSSGTYMIRFRSENGELLSTQSYIRR